ncbi:hypothetical protein [Flagellimonas marinaquae]|uniref:hypothetical protein n=1 Tax=Flagellimonas marinaquae TaxID=254955 RepID=UPI000F8DBAC6|nr:hypothetical protein [Allomuricauda aquimarina]
MKSFILRAISLGCFLLFGQYVAAQVFEYPRHGSEFYPNEEYSIVYSEYAEHENTDDSTMTYKEKKYEAFLLKGQDTIRFVGFLSESDLENTDFWVWINDCPKIDGVEKVILVDNLFSGCGDLLDSHYFLETSNGSLHRLPTLSTENMGNELYHYQYRFPNERFGREGRIVLGFLDLNQGHELKSFVKEKVFLWDGKDLIPE